MAKKAMYALGAIVLLIIIFLALNRDSPGGSFVGAMAKDDHNVQLKYPHHLGQKSGWQFNRGNWV